MALVAEAVAVLANMAEQALEAGSEGRREDSPVAPGPGKPHLRPPVLDCVIRPKADTRSGRFRTPFRSNPDRRPAESGHLEVAPG